MMGSYFCPFLVFVQFIFNLGNKILFSKCEMLPYIWVGSLKDSKVLIMVAHPSSGAIYLLVTFLNSFNKYSISSCSLSRIYFFNISIKVSLDGLLSYIFIKGNIFFFLELYYVGQNWFLIIWNNLWTCESSCGLNHGLLIW